MPIYPDIYHARPWIEQYPSKHLSHRSPRHALPSLLHRPRMRYGVNPSNTPHSPVSGKRMSPIPSRCRCRRRCMGAVQRSSRTVVMRQPMMSPSLSTGQLDPELFERRKASLRTLTHTHTVPNPLLNQRRIHAPGDLVHGDVAVVERL